VPLIFVQGDEAAGYEARRPFPNRLPRRSNAGTRTRNYVAGLDAESARSERARGIAEALAPLPSRNMRPYKPALPMTVTLRLRTMDAAAKAAQAPGVLRLDDHTVEAGVGRRRTS
jgi:D-aminopeptidase